MVALSCSGFSATTSWAVEQFGLAMMFFLTKPATASALTSGTISGTYGSIRQADELSITTAPAAPMFGDHSFGTAPAADVSEISGASQLLSMPPPTLPVAPTSATL